MQKQLTRKSEERLFRIKMLSHTGDRVHIKLPISFVKKMVQNNAINFFNTQDDIIDSESLLNLMIHSFDYNLSGEIAHIERKNGDIIKIIMD